MSQIDNIQRQRPRGAGCLANTLDRDPLARAASADAAPLLRRQPCFAAPRLAARRPQSQADRYRDMDPGFEEIRLLAPRVADALRDRAIASFAAPPPA